jgi:hypothetical protein
LSRVQRSVVLTKETDMSKLYTEAFLPKNE